MNAKQTYVAVLFRSVNQTMWADKILKEMGIPRKLIPVPRHISSDCGVCIRISPDHEEEVMTALHEIEGFDKTVAL